jgi:hypothetical protein
MTAPDPRKQAMLQSRNCRHCSGGGMKTVYHREYRSNPVTDIVGDRGECIQIAGAVGAHCVCPYGRWMREKTEPELLARIPDLQAVFNGDSDFLEVDPTLPDIPDAVFIMSPREALNYFRNATKSIGQRVEHDPEKERREARDRIQTDFAE